MAPEGPGVVCESPGTVLLAPLRRAEDAASGCCWCMYSLAITKVRYTKRAFLAACDQGDLEL